MSARLRLAPALGLVCSVWPVHMIWRANTGTGPAPVAAAEDIVILRPAFDPVPHLLPVGGGAFIRALMAEKTLAAALSTVGKTFELTAVLGLLIQGQAIVGIEE